jgi:hypothetical protein
VSYLAELFNEIIKENYPHSFKYIAFAIINDHNTMMSHNPTGNIQPFADVFGVTILTVDQLSETLSQSTE